MNIDVKKLINPIILLAVGLFNFIFLALDAIVYTLSYGGSSSSDSVSTGYKLISLETGGATAGILLTFAGIFTILTIIASIVLLAIGAIKLLGALNISVPGVDQFADVISKGEKLVLVENFIAQILTFLFVLVFGLLNSESYGGASIGYAPGVGVYLLLIFAAAAYVVVAVVFKNANVGSDAPKVEYVCTACGKTVKAGSNFCDTCGGSVKSKVKYPVIYVCSQCGTKTAASNKFCAKCGGAVIQKELIPTVYCCSACGEKASASDKFCAKCGGAVVEKQADN